MLAATWVLAIATIVLAVATILLAVGAFFTVLYAKRAFKDQSKELQTLADQLEVSREQFDEQKRLNVRQTDVLDLQQQDLRESLEQRQLAQAALIYVTNDYFSGRSSGSSEELIAGRTAKPPTVTATIYNASPQPIYDVRVMWMDARDLKEAGDLDFLHTIRPGEHGVAERELPPGGRSDAAIPVAYFRDAAGRRWTLLQDGYLDRVEPGNGPDPRGAIMRTPRSALGV
jgi:hypothetical protein